MAEAPTPDLNDLASLALSGAAGDFIFREGDVGTECFMIQEGQVELLKTIREEPCRLALLGTGDCFGESALFDEQPRDVSARALTEFRLLRIGRDAFDQIVDEDPRIAIKMVRRLASYLRDQRAAFLQAALPGAKSPDPSPGPGRLRKAPVTVADVVPVTQTKRSAALSVPGSKQTYSLAIKNELTVGRAGRAKSHTLDIDLTPVDTDRSVSRRHATILRKSGHYYLQEEPRVANGTFVNGKRLKAGRAVKLADGAQVCFGLVETLFTYRDE